MDGVEDFSRIQRNCGDGMLNEYDFGDEGNQEIIDLGTYECDTT